MFPNDIEEKILGSNGQQLAEGHIQAHEILNDAVSALETKVGVDGSEDVNSIDYKLNNKVALLNEDGKVDEEYIPSNVARLDENDLIQQQNIPNTIVQVEQDGKISVDKLPAIAINNTFTADTEEEMLALDAYNGDICVRNDESKIYWLKETPASDIDNWLVIQSAGQTLYKATAEEVAIGTDNSKYITPSALKNSNIIPNVLTNTFPANETTYTVNVSGLTANDVVSIIPQDQKVGTWEVNSSAGSFTITSDKTETSSVNFAYFIIKQ